MHIFVIFFIHLFILLQFCHFYLFLIISKFNYFKAFIIPKILYGSQLKFSNQTFLNILPDGYFCKNLIFIKLIKIYLLYSVIFLIYPILTIPIF
jgi:hypothetical protein